MKIYCLLGVGRSGVDFLQSLFDGHSQISQLPGVFYYEIFWNNLKKKTKNQIADEFIKNHLRFFDSKIYKQERHDQLGKNRNESFTVNKKIFKKNFIKLCKNPIDKEKVLVNLHLAYSKASGENIKKKKVILINVHQIQHLLGFEKLDFEIILNLRHPISSLNSSVKHWLNFSHKNVDLWWLNFQIDRLLNLVSDSLKFQKKIHIVRLDLIHLQNISYLKKISKIMRIKYEKSLNKSTYHGKLWWSDKLSNKNLNGFNKKFSDKFDYNLFDEKDIIYLENNFSFYYSFFKYKKILNKRGSFIYSFLPLKIELIVWKNIFKTFNLWQILLIPFYYAKRINMMKTNKKFKDKLINKIL